MLTFREKLLFSIISSIPVSILFSLYHSYFYFYLPIPMPFMTMLEVFVLGLPFYFFLVELTDSILGLFSGFIYVVLKEFLVAFFKTNLICPLSFLIFPIAFFIYCLGISFSREQSLKEAKMSLLATFILFLAFISSCFMLIIYYDILPETECISIFKFFSFFYRLRIP